MAHTVLRFYCIKFDNLWTRFRQRANDVLYRATKRGARLAVIHESPSGIIDTYFFVMHEAPASVLVSYQYNLVFIPDGVEQRIQGDATERGKESRPGRRVKRAAGQERGSRSGRARGW